MSQHAPARIYRGLRRRLDRVLFLADGESWLRDCHLEGVPHYFRHAYEQERQQRHEALNELEKMLRELERAGALTRAGAYLIASIFACAVYAGVNPLSPEGETFERLLNWAWKLERLWYPVYRWLHRSAS